MNLWGYMTRYMKMLFDMKSWWWGWHGVTCWYMFMARKMMGIESQGMLLLAEDSDGKLSLMQPDSDISNGAVVA